MSNPFDFAKNFFKTNQDSTPERFLADIGQCIADERRKRQDLVSQMKAASDSATAAVHADNIIDARRYLQDQEDFKKQILKSDEALDEFQEMKERVNRVRDLEERQEQMKKWTDMMKRTMSRINYKDMKKDKDELEENIKMCDAAHEYVAKGPVKKDRDTMKEEKVAAELEKLIDAKRAKELAAAPSAPTHMITSAMNTVSTGTSITYPIGTNQGSNDLPFRDLVSTNLNPIHHAPTDPISGNPNSTHLTAAFMPRPEMSDDLRQRFEKLKR
ncbi:hypothetical protein P280DRAFT_484574 [Massarina eburnea CBS 473.64]|uniref:Uncharacterized protein n=1 Tax=Massarina eburnea CBS 473.64 TaxID=1395130 RepID=A0A6A6RKH1_9PLEO|nr:hypothetical protein P280DRAFT_484574 [Massarina eburnea CBS 473.64]